VRLAQAALQPAVVQEVVAGIGLGNKTINKNMAKHNALPCL